MAGQTITVDDLVNQVRSLLDEDNRVSVTDADDILPALNRAQNYAANILSRHYESPMLKHVNVTTVTGQKEYPIPEDAFEQKLEKVETKVNNLYSPLLRISYRDISLYETEFSSSIPYYYTVTGLNYRIIPNSNATYPLRIWYLVDPRELVLQQGRINSVNTTDNYIIVDNVGSDLTTETDQRDSYINIVDSQTGLRKGSFQVKSINGNRINFKTSPTRTVVENITIDTDMSNLSVNSDENNEGPNVTIEPDDFICVLSGTCVPFFKKPFSNFLVQYAVAEIRRKLGGPAELEQRILKELEEQVERSWVGREHDRRITKRSNNWNLPTRRYYGVKG